MSNSMDGDQTQSFVGPDLCPNCLEMLSAGKTKAGLVFSTKSVMS